MSCTGKITAAFIEIIFNLFGYLLDDKSIAMVVGGYDASVSRAYRASLWFGDRSA